LGGQEEMAGLRHACSSLTPFSSSGGNYGRQYLHLRQLRSTVWRAMKCSDPAAEVQSLLPQLFCIFAHRQLLPRISLRHFLETPARLASLNCEIAEVILIHFSIFILRHPRLSTDPPN
jgi:hypothetical protein